MVRHLLQVLGERPKTDSVDVTWVQQHELEGTAALDAEETWRGHCDLDGPTGLTRYTIYVGRQDGAWRIGAKDPWIIDAINWIPAPYPSREEAMADARTVLLAWIAQRTLERTEEAS